MGGNRLMLIVAIVAGALAMVLAFTYINAATKAAEEPEQQVPLLFVIDDLPANHLIDPAKDLRIDRVGGHHRLPLGPFRVADLNRDRAAERDTVPNTGQHGDLVLFELHPGATAVAESAAGQLARYVVGGDADAGDHAFDHGHQCAAVGFTGRNSPLIFSVARVPGTFAVRTICSIFATMSSRCAGST